MAVENGSARIGRSVVIRGEVKGGEDLYVDGRIEGTISLSESKLTVGPNAVLAADLTAREVVVQGHVQGNIIAGGRVELLSGSEVIGDVRATRLAIEDNAVFRGKVDLTAGAAQAKTTGPETAASGLFPQQS
jgi:cytoskeletal protein CcmA (bactofilin family)